jgi:hypothetical protein
VAVDPERRDNGRSPTPLVWAATGATAFCLLGGVVGLVLGLTSHPPTAWFAVIEVALPASVLGGLLGLVCGSMAAGLRRRTSSIRARGGQP